MIINNIKQRRKPTGNVQKVSLQLELVRYVTDARCWYGIIRPSALKQPQSKGPKSRPRLYFLSLFIYLLAYPATFGPIKKT